MKVIHRVELRRGSKEELLPGISPDFPYIASRCELARYPGNFAPWHWHKEVELFYIESGMLEYFTPNERIVFPQGSGGMVNSNVLHMTRSQKQAGHAVQFLHIFDPSFVAGPKGSRIEQKYVLPLTNAAHVEIFPLFPSDPDQLQLLNVIRDSFNLSEADYGYEISLRNHLSEIWRQLLQISMPLLTQEQNRDNYSEKLKSMLLYIHEQFAEKVTISDIAAAAFISERTCHRIFVEHLSITPIEYLKSYRLQRACNLLVNSRRSVTDISHICGLGSSSYFGKVFREYFACTPNDYRKKWQDSDMSDQNMDIFPNGETV